MVPKSEVGGYGSTATVGHRGLPEGAQIRRGTGSGEFSSAYRTVGVYFHTSSQIFGKNLAGDNIGRCLRPLRARMAGRRRWRPSSLSDYFNSPGRLAEVWRRFESASRRPGVDPATFATELGVLAMQGFDNMGERVRILMIRNKFIAAQQSLALRRHLDGASTEASIGDIVDSCRVWESHAKAEYDGPDLKFPHTIAQVEEETRPHLGSVASDMLGESTGLLLPLPALSPPGGDLWIVGL